MAKRIWDLTVYYNENPIIDIPSLGHLKEAAWQVEKGSKTGHLHWQCYLNFDRAVRFTHLVKGLKLKPKTFRARGLQQVDDDPPWLSKIKLRQYCNKIETRVTGPYKFSQDTVFLSAKKSKSSDLKLKKYLNRKYEEIAYRQYYLDTGWQGKVEFVTTPEGLCNAKAEIVK